MTDSLSALIAQVQALGQRHASMSAVAEDFGERDLPELPDEAWDKLRTDVLLFVVCDAPVLAAALKDALETLEYIATKAGRHGDDARGAARSFLERHKETP